MSGLKTILTIFLYLLLLLLLLTAAGVVVLCPRIIYNWDWSSCFLLLAGLIGAGCLLRWIALSHRRGKARAFVEGVTEISSPLLAASQQQTSSLRKCWQKAMDELLRHASGKAAIYQFPWFVLLGESGCGKTAALQYSRLRLNLEENNAGAWAPFGLLVLKNSVFLDINGHLLDGNDEAGLWQKLAGQICQRRQKEPVNGIIVAVKAGTLSHGSTSEIVQNAQRLRNAIEIMQKGAQHRLPVYIMITQTDSLPGFSRLAQVLPEQRRRQAMGMINDTPYDTPAREFVSRAIAKLTSVMSDLRVELLYNVGDDCELVQLPAAISSLDDGLKTFACELFDFVRNDETPPLRGVFLTSACQSQTGADAPGTLFLREMNLPLPASAAPKAAERRTSSEPLFLHDFFSNVLSANRWLYQPLPNFARLQMLRRSIPLMTFMCLSFTACLLLTFSFLRESNSLQSFKHKFLINPSLDDPQNQDWLAHRLNELNAFSDNVRQLQQLNASLWWSMLRQSFTLQEKMNSAFVKAFRDTIIVNGIDQRLNNAPLVQNNSSADQALVGAYLDFLTTRIHLDRLASANAVREGTFNSIRTPAYAALMMTDRNFPADSGQIFDKLYQEYYLWGDDKNYLARDAEKYSDILIGLLEQDPSLLRQIVEWVNTEEGLTDITLADFWGGDPLKSADNKIFIGRAYTAPGKQRLLSILSLLHKTIDETAMNAPRRQRVLAILEKQESEMAVWYNQQVYANWLAFMNNFSAGRLSINTPEQLSSLATQASSLQGPYMLFIERCIHELPQFCGNDYAKMPPWLQLLIRVREWKLQAPLNNLMQNSGLLQQSKSFMTEIWDAAKSPQSLNAAKAPQKNMQPATLFALYQQYLSQATPVDGPLRRKEAYNSLKTVYALKFPDTSNPSQSQPAPEVPAAAGAQPAQPKTPPLEGAWQSFSNLKSAIVGIDGTDPARESVWNLLQGSMDTLFDWYCYESAEYLQTAWNNGVLAPSASVINSKKPLTMFNLKDGLLWQWQKSNAAPFVSLNAQGDYVNNILYGHQLPLRQELLDLLNNATKGAWGIQDEYTINITCRPTDVNPRGYEMPASVTLTMYASDGPLILKNVNLPASKTFKWRPTDGGTVELQVNFSSFSLIKRYTGDYGFAGFIEDFREGSKTLLDKEFPQSAQTLQDINVCWVKVNYTFDPSQTDPILRMAKLLNLKAPAKITIPLQDFLAPANADDQ